MGKKYVKHNFDVNTGKSEVIIWEKGKRYRGTAIVHEEDKDVMTQYTGLTIAHAKAEIKRAESKSRECKKEILRLQAQIVNLANKQIQHNQDAINLKEGLQEYIDNKANFAKKLRKFKKKQEVEATENK